MALFRSDSRDVDFVPGTVRLFEFDHHDGTLAAPELVLVPTPSSHPDDPLNWTVARKHLSLACVCLYTLALGLETSALYSIYVPYSAATGISIATLNSAVGVMYLCVGFAPILTNPLAAVIGKRPVYLGSMLLAIGIAVWSPFIRSTPEWYGRCALLGVAGGPIFGTTEPSIADVYFQHERAAPFSVYVVVLYLGALLCPLLGAYIAEGIDYQAVFYFNAIVIAVVFVFCFFFMEETNYHRDTDSIVTEARNETTPTHDDDDMPKPGAIQLQKVPASSHVVQADVRRKSFIQRLALWTRPRGSVLHNLRDGVLQPLQFLRLPIVWFCAIQYAFGQVYFNMINAITAQILYAPPYLFTTTQIGLTYLSPIIMTIPSVLAFGWYSDRFAIKMARRNGGISEPEHKLWLMMPLFIALPLSILFLGFAPYYGLHWAAYVIGGMGLSCAAGGVLTTAALNYLFDSYHDFKSDKVTSASEDSPQMLAVLPPAMAIPFGFGYAITPWIGNLKTFAISAACVAFAVNALALPMMRWGKSLRRRDAGILYGKGQ